ncbi:DUF5988 family protein [Streptomyces sp. NPDC002221]|uniref:DUF5988 family protein n=1 Tax=Streptomyces sp. NPDC002221 TaxID=3364639 RepID=UPI0036AF5850
MSEMQSVSGSAKAFLLGGPPTLQALYCLSDAVVADSERVVVAHCGRNEHFAFTGASRDLEGISVPIAEWAYSTVIAE